MGNEKLAATFDNFLETKVAKLENKIKIAIMVGTWVLVIIAFFFLFYSPKQKAIKKQNREIAKLEQEISQAKSQAAEIDKYRTQMAETEIMFKAARRLLPEQKEIPSLLTNISTEGTNSGLDIISFTPGGESVKEFYATIPVNISVRGPYHNIGIFLDKISKLERIVTVPSITLASPAMEGNEMMLAAALSLVTFRNIELSEKDADKKP